MKEKIEKLLLDISNSIENIESFTKGKTYKDYQHDTLLQSAVERQFEIIGEALNRMERVDEEITEKIGEHRKIVGFRNILAHGYDAVSDRVVWDICVNSLSKLKSDITILRDS